MNRLAGAMEMARNLPQSSFQRALYRYGRPHDVSRGLLACRALPRGGYQNLFDTLPLLNTITDGSIDVLNYCSIFWMAKDCP